MKRKESQSYYQMNQFSFRSGLFAFSLIFLLIIAGCAQEKNKWDSAKSSGDIVKINEYIAAYPNGKFTEEAQKLKESIIDRQDWEKAKDINTIDSLKTYLQKHPKTIRKYEAEQILLTLLEKKDWESIKVNPSVDSLEEFIKLYPQSVNSADAKIMLRSLIWNKAIVTKGNAILSGIYGSGYMRYISKIQVQNGLESPLGHADVQYVINGNFERSQDGKTIARNNSDPTVSGTIVTKETDGTSTTTNLVGVIWATDENLLNSWLYSYDTHLGVSSKARYEGYTACPPINNSKAVTVFKIGQNGALILQP
jgi:outer membrane protein assembly factor BamD (BamD/ComL family)